MKKISLLILFCFFLSACSDESTLKKKGLELAEQKFNENIKTEVREAVPNSEVIQQAYVDFMRGKSEVEVTDVKIQSPTTAVVSTSVTTYPVKLRKTLLGVAKTVGLDKTRRFNFADAAPMVASQIGMKAEVEKQSFEVYKFQKQSDKWIPLD